MRTPFRGAALAAVIAFTSACSSDADKPATQSDSIGVDDLPPLSDDVALPIVFVHGFAGSASQYQSQQMRFAANGYPADRIIAYDHDGAGLDLAAYVTGLDAVVDAALSKFGVDQVYLVGHSRGTGVSAAYVGTPERAAKVAKYVAIDGTPCPAVVPCVAPTQAVFTGQAHVEVATSKESFAMQYEFLVGEAPSVVDIVPQKAPVVISGRAVNFPANTGRDGATLDVWAVEAATGEREGASPVDSFAIGADGEWGPLTVDPTQHYELVLRSSDSPTQQHFYMQTFPRSSHFVRLLSGDSQSPTRVNTNSGDGHAAVLAMRMREWYTSDVLSIETQSAAGNMVNANVITPDVANGSIALHIHDDAATPGETTLKPLPFFSSQPFQKSLDVYMPAAPEPNGVITLTNVPRGDEAPQRLAFPNWASSGHFITVVYSDYAQD